MERTIIVSNRLPLQVDMKGDDIQITPSVGGLTTGLKSFHQKDGSIWIGWPGITKEELKNDKIEAAVTRRIEDHKCKPVYLNQKELDRYYYGFSNRVLWPLFHYFTVYTKFNLKMWNAYKSVNQTFANHILEEAGEEDTVWIHDYHLMLLPKYLRERRPNLKIGFFLHIPFPSYEIFRILPIREELLDGLLGADLIGFHTFDYQRHFIDSVEALTDAKVNYNQLIRPNGMSTAEVFPMGIDVRKFEETALRHHDLKEEEKSDLRKEIENHMALHPGMKLILSIDRLDYSKGIPNRIKAFDYFLKRNPKYHGRVRLVMLAVPSRTKVPQYQELKKEVDELVGRINGRYAKPGWTPIWYFYRSMPFDHLIDLYTHSDIALLTPLRDGMNLVAKEYIISRVDQTGVLILSEMAGASKEMSETLLINPHNFQQINDALIKALEMPVEEQKRVNKILQGRLRKGDIKQWAARFMDQLQNARKSEEKRQALQWNEDHMEYVLDYFQQANKRVVVLDLDGHMAPADCGTGKIDISVTELILKLAENKNNDLVIISDREQEPLREPWNQSPVTVIADSGLTIFKKGEKIYKHGRIDTHWKRFINPLLHSYVGCVPGSFVEEKQYALGWHYEQAEPIEAAKKANELTILIRDLVDPQEITVFKGNNVIQVTSAEINKGRAIAGYLEQNPADFILVIGNDPTDEAVFSKLPEDAFSIRIGSTMTDAQYFMKDEEEIKSLLESLIKKDQPDKTLTTQRIMARVLNLKLK